MIFKIVFTVKRTRWLLMHTNSGRFSFLPFYWVYNLLISNTTLAISLTLRLPMQAHSRAMETTRSISQITVNFFNTLDTHATNLSQIVEEAQTDNDQKLFELEKKFEVIKLSIWRSITHIHAYPVYYTSLCICRNALRMKKDNFWKRLQNCLLALILGRKNWYDPSFHLQNLYVF